MFIIKVVVETIIIMKTPPGRPTSVVEKNDEDRPAGKKKMNIKEVNADGYVVVVVVPKRRRRVGRRLLRLVVVF